MNDLHQTNPSLFYFGLINFIFAMMFALFAFFKPISYMGVNAWYKPIKFALSIGIYTWTMGIFSRYLVTQVDIRIFNWVLIVSLGFEIIYIGIQAARGMGSHFNLSTPIYSFLYVMMAIGASIAALAGAWMGYQFFTREFQDLDPAFLWSIRTSIIIFVFFAFQGFTMGSRLTHNVGVPDGGPGIPFLNWSRIGGDLRIAHFLGMHAIQVIPTVTYLWIRDVRGVIGLSIAYFLMTLLVLLRALSGKAFF